MLSDWKTTRTVLGTELPSLNAAFGARRFLTQDEVTIKPDPRDVLMHLLALGAF